jgi:type VI secretion system secreted protein VgrG
MAVQYTQENRQIAVSTSLGKDVLLLTGFDGQEEISRLFHFQLDMISSKLDIAAKDLVGKPITWTIKRGSQDPRYFNGLVSRFSAGGLQGRGLRHYRVEVVPWLWLLTRTADCRIFQNKTAPDIIEQIFKDLGQKDYKLTVGGTHPKREYCVQYRETDFNFVSRLMEEEGIFYSFEHENGKHTLVLADQKSAYKACLEKTAFYAPGVKTANHVTRWEHRYEMRPGKYAQTDYNFETPSTSLMTQSTSVCKVTGNDKLEVYDYPGIYTVKGDGGELTKVRMEEEEAVYDVVAGDSTCRTFTAGGKFTLESHECATESDKGFVITSVTHGVTEPTYTAGKEVPFDYHNSFTCIPDSVVFRPARITPRPVVKGPQTAVVVGPKGEEIYTDKYGRVKVQFHWDREGKKDENSSCWIRVSQGWAGKNLGILFNPRIGQEVVVDFLEGDPDRPLITGRVYNAELMPPWELPAKQSRSGIRTLSTKGGARENYNAIGFEDATGKEELYVHAERDHNLYVENNNYIQVGSGDSKYCPDGSQKIEVWKNRTEIVHKGDETITIETGKRTEEVSKGDETITIKEGDRKVTVTKGNDTHEVGTDRTVIVDKGNDSHQIKKGYREVKIDTGDDKLTVTTGNQKIDITAGKSETSAAQSITLKVSPATAKLEPSAITLSIGASSIKLEPAAITLTVGPSTVKLEPAAVTISGLKLAAEGKLQSDFKGGIQTGHGQAVINKVAGAVVMIG